MHRLILASMAALIAVSALAPSATAAGRRTLGTRTLAVGMRGTDVRVLQDFLTQAGFKTPVDGMFGRRTRQAVRRWERAQGLGVDGRVTKGDAGQLRARISGVGAAQAPEPLPPVEKATLGPDGLAVAPASAPEAVQQIIAAGNAIASKPYRYGGGHGKWDDTGYDCSGSMSYALHGAALIDQALDSTGFESFGDPGKGQWVTTYAHGSHSYMVVAGLRFDTSGLQQDGSRWHTSRRSASGYVVRHPAGL